MRVQVVFFALLLLGGAFAQNTKLNVVVQIFQGFVNGLAQEVDVHEVQSCIKDSDAIFNDFQTAVVDFSKNNAGAAWNGIQALVAGLQLLPSAMQDCKQAAQEVQTIAKAISAFGSPVAFFYDVTKNIFVNHKEITSDINNAINAWNSQDWTNYGFYIGEAVGLSIFGNPSIHAVTAQDLPDIFAGILKGIGAQTGYPEIAQCIDLSSEVAQNITAGSAEIVTGNYQQVLQGIITIAQTLQVLPTAVQLCQGAEQDAVLLWNAIQQYKTPKSFIWNAGKNLLVNGVDVYNELANASVNYKAGNWYYYGYDLGLMLATIVWGNNVTVSGNDAANVLNFAYGFIVGVGDQENWPEIKNCIDTSEEIAVLLRQAYNNFTKETPSSVLAGIVALGEAAQIVPNAIQECNATVKDLKAIIAAIKAFQSPASFFYHVGVSLLLNGREILHDINNAVNAYKAGNFYNFGYYTGKAAAVLILGDKASLGDQEFAEFLNQRVGWDAGVNPKFAGMTKEQFIQQYIGANIEVPEDVITFDYDNLVQDVPTNFDARQVWPNCIHPIRDQAHCGSCWAFAATETLSDRFCIASNGSTNVILSPQYLVSCDKLAFGCNGGNIYQSWLFMSNTGVVTDSCAPYVSGNGSVPKCSEYDKCHDGSKLKKYHSKLLSIASLKNPASIQANLMQYGPVDTGFEVYEDFMYYTGGIYTHTSGQLLGGHAVKIVGWGEENGVKYWIVANSWGEDWGEKGFFRIAFGQCGIDSDAVAGQPDLSK